MKKILFTILFGLLCFNAQAGVFVANDAVLSNMYVESNVNVESDELSQILASSYGANLNYYDSFDTDIDAEYSDGSETSTFTATRSATAPATYVENQDGNALLFDGVDSEVTGLNPVSALIGSKSACSIFLKVKRDSIGSRDVLVDFTRDGTSSKYFLEFQADNTIRLGGRSADESFQSVATTGTFLSEDIIYNIVAILDVANDTAKIYVNGVDEALAGTVSFTNTSFETAVGDDSTFAIAANSVDNPFIGQIKDIKAYDKVLTPTEVSTLYNDGSVTTGLIAHYDFSDGTGSTLTDVVGSNDGTITGAQWLTDGTPYITKTTTDDAPRYNKGDYDETGFIPYTGIPGAKLEGESTNYLKESIFSDTADAGEWESPALYTNGVTLTNVSASDISSIPGHNWRRMQHTFDGTEGTFKRALDQKTANGSVSLGDNITASFLIKGSCTCSDGTLTVFISGTQSGSYKESIGTYDLKGFSSTEPIQVVISDTLTNADTNNIAVQFGYTGSAAPTSGVMDISITDFQVEKSKYPSSFIPTTTSALTRGAEALSGSVDKNFVGGTDGTIVMVYRPIMLPDEQPANYKQIFKTSADADNYFQIAYDTNANNQIVFTKNSEGTPDYLTSTTAPLGDVRYSLHSAAFTYSTTADGDGKKEYIYIDGVVNASNTGFTAPVGLGETFIIQGQSGQAMQLVAIALFNRALTATEIADLHSIIGVE